MGTVETVVKRDVLVLVAVERRRLVRQTDRVLLRQLVHLVLVGERNAGNGDTERRLKDTDIDHIQIGPVQIR